MERSLSVPPEVKITIYIVLEDKRWIKWFESLTSPGTHRFQMLVDPHTGETVRDIMARLQLLDQIPLRLPVSSSPQETHAVMALSAALTTYDVSEKDCSEVVVLHWEETDPERKKLMGVITRAKLVSELAVKTMYAFGFNCFNMHQRSLTRKYFYSAIQKQGGAEKLAAHLQYKKERVRKAYDKCLAEYEAASKEKMMRKARGDKAGADAVTLKNAKKVQKTRPKIPAILKEPFKLLLYFYQTVGIMQTNFLVFDNGRAVAETLVECTACVIMANLRWQDSGRIATHEQEEHIIPRDSDLCSSGCYIDFDDLGLPARCDACLNFQALAEKEELDAAS
ncbi:hypothetical protein B0H11DRAFT_2406555 [Mycena galericulata]|nr:hypothetical protein B0H11DRAFT_2406555 [Mycena galericulata]